MPNQPPRVCPICGTSNLDRPVLALSQPPWQLKQCSNCTMVYLENPPAYELLEEEFAWERTFAAESEKRSRRNPLLHKLSRLPKAALQRISKRDKLRHLIEKYVRPGPVLDVGCAGGHTLASLPSRFIPNGIEISHELSRIAERAFSPRGGRVVQSDALSGLGAFSPAEFTGIVMTSFLEHEVNARETLLAARRVMQPGAALIVKVPNFDSWNRHLRGAKWCGLRFPDHVNHFTPALLTRLLNDTGFHVIQFNLSDRLPTSDTMWLVASAAND